MATLNVLLAPYSGQTGLVAKLYAAGGTDPVNGVSGDTLTESTNGWFAATVTETLTGWHWLVVEDSGGTALAMSELKMGDATVNVGESAQVAGSISSGQSIVYVSFGLAVENRQDGSLMKFYQGEQGFQHTIPVADAAGAAIDLTGKTLKVRIYDSTGTQQAEVDATGADGSASFIVPSDFTTTLTTDYTWRLLDVTGGIEYRYGGGAYHVGK